MPTISVETSPALTNAARRAVAVPVTRWLAERGVRPAHVVLRFSTADEADIYSGGMPLNAMNRDDAGLHHARVVCRVAPDRDAEFCAGLARTLAAALTLDEATTSFVVEFRPTDPDHIYLAEGSDLVTAASRNAALSVSAARP